MGWYLFSGRARVIPRIRGLRIQWAMFFDILKVGAVSCFSPLQSVLTISIFTHMLAGFGTQILAGYGIGARLEFMLTSIAFAVGIASVPMVGMAIGAGPDRACEADCLDRGPGLVRVGRRDRHADRDLPRPLGQHLHRDAERARREPAISVDGRRRCTPSSASPSTMYFSSQGAAKVLGPVLAQTARLLFIAPAAGGCRRTTPPRELLRAGGGSMVVLGVLSASSVMLTRWGPRRSPRGAGPAGIVVTRLRTER